MSRRRQVRRGERAARSEAAAPAAFETSVERLAEWPKPRLQLGVNTFAVLARYAPAVGLREADTATRGGVADVAVGERDHHVLPRQYPGLRRAPGRLRLLGPASAGAGFLPGARHGHRAVVPGGRQAHPLCGECNRTAEILHGMMLFWVPTGRRELALRHADGSRRTDKAMPPED